MKALEINGQIKVYTDIPNSFKYDGGVVAGGGKNLSDEELYNLGFRDVVKPTYEPRTQQLVNLHLDGDVYTYDVIEVPFKETLAELKDNKVSELKSLASAKLSETDWYIIREADSGEATPQFIKDERAALRASSNTIEAEINALTTKKSVVLFDINL